MIVWSGLMANFQSSLFTFGKIWKQKAYMRTETKTKAKYSPQKVQISTGKTHLYPRVSKGEFTSKPSHIAFVFLRSFLAGKCYVH